MSVVLRGQRGHRWAWENQVTPGLKGLGKLGKPHGCAALSLSMAGYDLLGVCRQREARVMFWALLGPLGVLMSHASPSLGRGWPMRSRKQASLAGASGDLSGL